MGKHVGALCAEMTSAHAAHEPGMRALTEVL
jgi:hypothetical protein